MAFMRSGVRSPSSPLGHPTGCPLVLSDLVGSNGLRLCRRFGGPDLSKNAFEVAAKDALYFGIAILSADQPLGKIKHPFRMVQSFYIDLLAKTIAALIACSKLFIQLRRHLVVPIKVDVAADPEVLGSDQLSNMVEMIKDVLDRCRFVNLYEHSHAGYSHHAAAVFDLFDRLVGFAARMTRHKCTAVRVRDQNRLLRYIKGVKRGFVAAM